jgi:hypothetical protein
MKIEHVFGSSYPMASAEERPRKINDEESLEEQQSACLPGKYKRTLHPQTGGNKEIP